MLECAIHPITYRGEGILATVVKSQRRSLEYYADILEMPIFDFLKYWIYKTL